MHQRSPGARGLAGSAERDRRSQRETSCLLALPVSVSLSRPLPIASPLPEPSPSPQRGLLCSPTGPVRQGSATSQPGGTSKRVASARSRAARGQRKEGPRGEDPEHRTLLQFDSNVLTLLWAPSPPSGPPPCPGRSACPGFSVHPSRQVYHLRTPPPSCSGWDPKL